MSFFSPPASSVDPPHGEIRLRGKLNFPIRLLESMVTCGHNVAPASTKTFRLGNGWNEAGRADMETGHWVLHGNLFHSRLSLADRRISDMGYGGSRGC